MKATFDVTVKIDGAKVESIFSMRDGVENIDVKVIDKGTIARNGVREILQGGCQ